MENNIKYFHEMYKIRLFEERLLNIFSEGKVTGTTHTYIGQEATAVSIFQFINDEDIIVSNHRSHGHFLCYSKDYVGLLHEINGSIHGVTRGIGGTQQLQYNNFYSNGILGGTVPLATGLSFAEKLKKTSSIGICFIGDGALGEGVVYESFNIASLWDIPILFVVENNQFAQSTPTNLNLAGSIKKRFESFDIPTQEISSNDILKLIPEVKKAISYVRENSKPFCQIINNYRLGPHSKGDDSRDQSEIDKAKINDPIVLARKYLKKYELNKVEKKVQNEINKIFKQVFTEEKSHNNSGDGLIETDSKKLETLNNDYNLINKDDIYNVSNSLMVKELNSIYHRLMNEYDRMYMLGEDILDPYGGAFKVTKGLFTAFPERVLSSPISESALVGIANGMAVRGLLPFVEIMFGDFVTLIVDQVVNYISKFNSMYNIKMKHAPIIRTPMGGYRGYGPTHSQTLEKLFFGVPGLLVISNDQIHNQHYIIKQIIQSKMPCIYVENKTVYGQRIFKYTNGMINNFYCQSTNSFFPSTLLQIAPFQDHFDLVLVTYGGMLNIALETAKKLFFEDEIIARIILVSQLSPFPRADVIQSIEGCNKIVVIEEGTKRNGWGAELISQVVENTDPGKILKFKRCSALDSIIPSAKNLEMKVLPSVDKCYENAKSIL